MGFVGTCLSALLLCHGPCLRPSSSQQCSHPICEAQLDTWGPQGALGLLSCWMLPLHLGLEENQAPLHPSASGTFLLPLQTRGSPQPGAASGLTDQLGNGTQPRTPFMSQSHCNQSRRLSDPGIAFVLSLRHMKTHGRVWLSRMCRGVAVLQRKPLRQGSQG